MTEETADEMAADDEADDETADLADRVAEYDAELGSAVADLEARVETLESDLSEAEARADDMESKLKRTQADFQNYKKRAKEREAEIKERATEDFVTRLVPVRDDLVRALDQDEGVDIRDGVESTLETFDRVLEEENVTPIQPAPGEEVDPTRHQVMMRVESDHPEGTVADVYRPGYEMAGKVIQEAQVTVSEGE
ncbi:molecular chaperone GrpE [Haloplanus vescus]|uniref:Protein GrpE n=1 Tax=Haloplanus vescus TaxID=555874 RepID=A0A1H3VSU3_9EURY|nr:molecular chaperone GrpE [Haloplanus vescus]